MNQLTQAERNHLWEEVRADFPQDEMMQEIHFVRLVHYWQTKDLSPQQRIKFFGQPEKADLVS